jgi:hypothetical protein
VKGLGALGKSWRFGGEGDCLVPQKLQSRVYVERASSVAAGTELKNEN